VSGLQHMILNSKLTWGLAWTGLAVVLAVPSADFLTGQFGRGSDAAVLTSDVEPVKTASVDPATTTKVTTIKTDKGLTIVPAGGAAPADPVDKYLSSGKPLPDYISGDEKPAGQQVATVAPEPVIVPRMPLPSSARPGPIASTPAVAPAPAAPVTPAVAQPEPALIVDESTLTGSVAQPTGPVPPAPIVDDTTNWDNESLRDYLERRGILEGGDTRSSATVTERDAGTYDPDGFYLSDGPNGDRTIRETRRQRILRMLEESENSDGLTLF
jgi:hypothetical protein